MWKRHHRWAADSTWDTVLTQLTAQVDSSGGIGRTVSANSTNRAHQHATNTARPKKDTAGTRRIKSEGPGDHG